MRKVLAVVFMVILFILVCLVMTITWAIYSLSTGAAIAVNLLGNNLVLYGALTLLGLALFAYGLAWGHLMGRQDSVAGIS